MGMERVLMGTRINISLFYHISTKMVPVCEPQWQPACISTDLRAIYWRNRLTYYISWPQKNMIFMNLTILKKLFWLYDEQNAYKLVYTYDYV